MPRRAILTERQRCALFDLPTDDGSLHRYYTFADDDLKHIARRRRSENKFGFALQLCALRYPGRVLRPGELIPAPVVEFIGSQLNILIAARTEEGRRAAQARGVPFGRPPKLRPDQRTLARNLIEEGKSVSDVARTFNVHVATIYRCLHDEAAL